MTNFMTAVLRVLLLNHLNGVCAELTSAATVAAHAEKLLTDQDRNAVDALNNGRGLNRQQNKYDRLQVCVENYLLEQAAK